MKTSIRTLHMTALLMLVTLLSACQKSEPERTKIGFLVKMPEQAWFINEQRAATEAGAKLGFDVIKMGVPDGEKTLAAIDNLSAQGAQGFVICAPDVRLGTAIAARARQHGLKVVTVDDQLVDANGVPISTIPHLGMSGFKIGEQVGESLVAEMNKRQWPAQEVGILRITNYELPTAKQRTDGATSVLLKSGLASEQIYDAAQRTSDTEGGFNAALPVLSKHAEVKYWLIYALNEESVLGAVRATEQLKIDPANVIGVGINGAGEAFAEFSKSQPTGFFGTIAVSSTMHGRDTAVSLFEWIAHGKQPAASVETIGTLMTRDNWQQVRADLGL